jgi:hypothetical protein
VIPTDCTAPSPAPHNQIDETAPARPGTDVRSAMIAVVRRSVERASPSQVCGGRIVESASDVLDHCAHGAGGFCAGGAARQPFDEAVEIYGG